MVESPDYVTSSISSILSTNTNNISNTSNSKTGSDSSLATPGRQRPMFSLDSDSSDENDDNDYDGQPACPVKKYVITSLSLLTQTLLVLSNAAFSFSPQAAHCPGSSRIYDYKRRNS
jgi:hypothetical protein